MSVGLREIIEWYQKRLTKAIEDGNNDEQFSCLMFALQLPSMCARLDFPRDKYKQFYSDGNPKDRKLYIAWLKKYYKSLVTLSLDFLTFEEFCLAVYELRCNLTHAGILASNEKLQGIRFLSVKCFGMGLGDEQYISFSYLCNALFACALESVSMITVSIREGFANQSGCYLLSDNSYTISYISKLAATDTASLVVDTSELPDTLFEARKQAGEFLGKKSDREIALYFLHDYLSHWQVPVFDEMGKHFAKRDDEFSREIDCSVGGAVTEDKIVRLKPLSKPEIFRAKDDIPSFYGVYILSLDAGAYREMKKIVREFEQFIQRGKAL